ncbi:MAG: rhodanese-like domain-containing protein [Candidatus Kapabacteria bacterium]|nr:rhodanese-like domain-containing protein [Candidatus Kapabacteria bacterium]
MIKSITASELDSWQKENKKFKLIDVREPFEVETGFIENSHNIPLAGIMYNSNALMAEIPKESEIVVYCAHGMRSQSATMALMQAGFENVYSLVGGIAAWYDGGFEK